MQLVIDSGAALSASMSMPALGALRRHDLIGPPLLWSEVYSALHEAVWRRELDDRTANQVLRTFASLEIRRRSPARLHAEAYAIATELAWAKSYDAEFLALAKLEGERVLTTDARLRRGADRIGLVMDPSELPRP